MDKDSYVSGDSISMGPPSLMTESEIESDQTNSFIPDKSSPSTEKEHENHGLSALSVSSIHLPDDCDVPHLLSMMCSPNGPDILMSTQINMNPTESNDSLTISVGPLSEYEKDLKSSSTSKSDLQSKLHSSLVQKIDQLEKNTQISPAAITPKTIDHISTQTEQFKCQKCEELHIYHNKKLLEMANEIQLQYATHLQNTDDYNKASENAQKQIKDLKDQLEAADKQLKANRTFLDLQAAEREQEREEAQAQQNQLKAALSEREKELERERDNNAQVAADLMQLHEMLNEKDSKIIDTEKVQQKMQDELELLKERQSDVDDENDKLQTILKVKDNLLKAQADQIAALRSELEKQMNPPSESEKENDLTADHIEPAIQISLNSTGTEAVSEDMPTFFEEIQQLIVSMLHKVDRSARALEAAQWSKQKTSLVVSPRNLNTPSTSTEDISIKDRNRQSWLDNLRESSPSPPAMKGHVDSESALSFLQELDGRFITLGRVQESVCKRIADLEAELRRTVQSEKQSASKVIDLEQQKKQQQQQFHDIESEKKELQAQHTELLKRISSLENRLEEQRRSAVMGATQNLHSEKFRAMSEENQQLVLVVKEKEECIDSMKQEAAKLHQRIGNLMKCVLEKEQESKKLQDSSNLDSKKLDDFSNNERLRDAPFNEASLNWTKLQSVANSPVALSPINPPPPQKMMPPSIHFEVEELKSKLRESEQRYESLSVEQRSSYLDNELLDKIQKEKEQLELRCEKLEKDLDDCVQQLNELETSQQRCTVLENQLSSHQKLLKEAETVHQQRCQVLENQLSARQKLVDSLETDLCERKRTAEREAKKLHKLLAAGKEDVRLIETLRVRCATLEAEVAAQQSTIDANRVIQQRVVLLEKDVVQYRHNLESAQQQCKALSRILDTKEHALTSLNQTLKCSEKTVDELQQKIAALKLIQQQLQQQVQQQQQQHKKTILPDCNDNTYQDGPTAPPDLLARSFVEMLGSATSSRCSSRKSSSGKDSPILPATDSTLDCSLPSSMTGKQMLKDVRTESELILALLQKQEAKRKQNASPSIEHIQDELDATLTPDAEAAQQKISQQKMEKALREEIELLEHKLAMERMASNITLESQRSLNAMQQKRILELLAQLKRKTTDNRNASSQTNDNRFVSSGSAVWQLPKDEINYRVLKLESVNKNLLYQKKFLVTFFNEFNSQKISSTYEFSGRPPTKRARNPNKLVNRFRVAALAIISIERMRLVLQRWRYNRREIMQKS